MRPRSAGRLKSSESSECSIHDEGLPELLPKVRKTRVEFSKRRGGGASLRAHFSPLGFGRGFEESLKGKSHCRREVTASKFEVSSLVRKLHYPIVVRISYPSELI